MNLNDFEPKRLTEIREARGLRQTFLARELDVTRSSVSKWETGKANPKEKNITDLSALLDVPLSYFFLKDKKPIETITPIYFRKLSRTNKTHRQMAYRRLEWFGQIISTISEFVNFPETKIVKPKNDEFRTFTHKEIEDIARETRNLLKIPINTPIGDLINHLEGSGIFLSRFAIANTLDAFSTWIHCDGTQRPIILFDTIKDSNSRTRFNISHELGHLVMHGGSKHYEITPEELKRIEKEANYFAACFLMPSVSFKERAYVHGKTFNGLMKLKKEWKVSLKAIVYRLKDLGIISLEESGRLFSKLNYSYGYKMSEPGEEFIPNEEPTLIKRGIELLNREDVYSLKDLYNDFFLSIRDISELTGLSNEDCNSMISSIRESDDQIINLEVFKRAKEKI